MLVCAVSNKPRPSKQSVMTQLQAGVAVVQGFGSVLDELPMFTYWNLLDKSASITLTDNDLTATANSNTNGAVRAVDGKTAGRWYFEVQNNNVSLSNSAGIGLIDGSTALADIMDNGFGIVVLGAGSIFLNGVFQFALGSIVGNNVQIAYDADNQLAWFRRDVSQQDWNDDAGADPTNALGGIDVSGIVGPGGLFPVVGTGDTGNTFTANFGTTPFQFERPDGFTGWTTDGS